MDCLQPNYFTGAKLIWKVLWSQSVPMKLSPQPLNFKKLWEALNNLEVRLEAIRWRTRLSRRLWTLPKQKSELHARLFGSGTSNKSGVHGSERIAQQCVDQENAFI